MTLAKDALDLAVRKSLEDMNTLMRFIDMTEDPAERLKHVRRARELLEELEHNHVRLIQGGTA